MTLDDYELMLAELKAEKKYKIAKFNREISALCKQIKDIQCEVDNLKFYGKCKESE